MRETTLSIGLFVSSNAFFTCLLFVVAAVWASLQTSRLIILVLWAGLSFVILGFGLNILAPDFFDAMAIIQDKAGYAEQESYHRLFGFYLQANRAAHSVISILLLMFIHAKWNKPSYMLMVLGIFSILILMTGSRSGMLILAIFILLYFTRYFFIYLRKEKRFSNEAGVLSTSFIGMVSAVTIVLTLLIAPLVLQALDYGVIAERLQFFQSGNIGNSIKEDESFKHRFKAQQIAFESILANPLFGSGPKAATKQDRINTDSELSAHNIYLESGKKFGMLYIFFYLFTLFLTYLYAQRVYPQHLLLESIAVITFLYGINLSSIYGSRAFIVILGFGVGYNLQLYFKRYTRPLLQ